MRLATSVTIAVLATLVVAAVGYGGMAIGLRHAAATPSPVISPVAKSTPIASLPEINAPASAGGSLAAVDVDMLNATIGWMLVSDCGLTIDDTCHNLVVRTSNGGETWFFAVAVGGPVPVAGGRKLNQIRFLNGQDGFVYGADVAFVTHDGGQTWAALGFDATFIAGIAFNGDSVWAATYPCQKGQLCPYQVLLSTDAGRTWSPPHDLPAAFSPEDVDAFDGGALLASKVSPFGLQVTTDQGATWQAAEAGCAYTFFRGTTATSDGVELWQLCQSPDSTTGILATRSMYVSEDAGKTWTERKLATLHPAWLVPLKSHTALAESSDHLLITDDAGVTWKDKALNVSDLTFVRVRSDGWVWGLDAHRTLWSSADGGATWVSSATLPSTID